MMKLTSISDFLAVHGGRDIHPRELEMMFFGELDAELAQARRVGDQATLKSIEGELKRVAAEGEPLAAPAVVQSAMPVYHTYRGRQIVEHPATKHAPIRFHVDGESHSSLEHAKCYIDAVVYHTYRNYTITQLGPTSFMAAGVKHGSIWSAKCYIDELLAP